MFALVISSSVSISFGISAAADDEVYSMSEDSISESVELPVSGVEAEGRVEELEAVGESDDSDVVGESDTEALADSSSGCISIFRIEGDDRFETGVAVSQKVHTPSVPVVYLASGFDFADALSAAPASVKEGGAFLLTHPKVISKQVQNEIKRLGPNEIVIVGGKAAVSAEVERTAKSLAPKVTRVGGADRYETSRLVVKRAFPSVSSVYLATGVDYPDALSAGAAAGSERVPVILVNGKSNKLDAETMGLLRSLSLSQINVIGGTGAVNAQIESAAKTVSSSVKRIGGNDRYQTSQLIAKDTWGTSPKVYLASGRNFPDALVGAAAGGTKNQPVITIKPETSSYKFFHFMWDAGIEDAEVLGGAQAIMPDLEYGTFMCS